MIVTIANQKGGVGKTTITLLYAHYLSQKGIKPLLVDLDHQRSLMQLRRVDCETFDNLEVPFEIVELDISKLEETESYLHELSNSSEYTILDAPGNLTEQGLLLAFAYSDYIVIPFQYERKCLDSTGVMINVIEQISTKLVRKPKMIFLPNRVKSGEGIKSEKEAWAQVDDTMSNYGYLLPPLKELTCFKRVNSFALTKEQEALCQSVFEIMTEKICQENS